MKNKLAKRLGHILREYYKGGLSPELENAIRGLLASEKHEKEQDRILEDLFCEKVKPSRIANKNTLDSLDDIHRRLNFSPHPSRVIRMRRMTMKIAAAVIPAAMVIGALFTIDFQPADPMPGIAQQVRVEVPEGMKREIQLPDGSEIDLAEGTLLHYSEDFLNDRTVHLNGEAYFRVEKKDGQTFTVNTNSITVTVLGTEFSLKARPEAQTAEVILTTGKVEVEAEGADKTILSPGERIVYNKEHKTITVDEIGERELMRLRGMSIDFDNSLDEIFQTLSNYYGRKIIVTERMDLSRNIIVPFKGTETVEQVMEALRFMTGGAFDYTIGPDTIRITGPN